MSYVPGSVLETIRDDRNERPALHFLPANYAMGELLAGVLVDHQVVFERRKNLLTLVGPQDHVRIVALLRQVLSEPERRAVSVFAGDGSEFPTPRLLDEWWRVFETSWFSRAMAEHRFVTWYQPIADTASHRIVAHECLIRLPGARTYSGAEILDAARVRNEIHVFDSYARSLAIRSAASQSRGGVYFVNFLPSSIYHPELCLKATLQTLADSGLQPRNVVFEVVESELVRDPAHLRRVCDYYRNQGFGIALDDVGAEADSESVAMQMLGDLRPDFIKLDTNLTHHLDRPLCAAKVRKLVELSERFGVTVIAEGVERKRIMENLWLLGVQCMQGYLIGRPKPQISRPENDLANLMLALQASQATEECDVSPVLAVH